MDKSERKKLYIDMKKFSQMLSSGATKPTHSYLKLKISTKFYMAVTSDMASRSLSRRGR
jgi:hypothetical protein